MALNEKMLTSQGLSFQSSDNRFAVTLSPKMLKTLNRESRLNYPNETGGILLGNYSNDLRVAAVTHITGAPPDSRSSRRWFYRGISGLQGLIDRFWKRQEYYLGEWHLHPNSDTQPSAEDILQMETIASSHDYSCPEPILLIVGGSPSKGWKYGTYVIPKHSQLIELDPVSEFNAVQSRACSEAVSSTKEKSLPTQSS